jgi:hypothetical protein
MAIKLCACGCGQPTLRKYHGSKRTGPFADFIQGHQGRNNTFTAANRWQQMPWWKKLPAIVKRFWKQITLQSPQRKTRTSWTPERRERASAQQKANWARGVASRPENVQP